MLARFYFRIKEFRFSLMHFTAMLVLALVISTSFATTTFAQTPTNPCDTSKDDTLYYFKTLFCGSVTPTARDGKVLDPRTPSTTGFINADGITKSITPVVNSDTSTIGLKNINVGIWLIMDPNKNLFGWWKKGIGDPADPTGYFFDLVAKDTSGNENNTFLLRTEYQKKDGTKHYAYTGITARELEKDALITNGDLKQFAFFEENKGSTSQKIVTHQQVRSTVTFPEDVAYGSEINVDLWYCGGSADENYKVNSNNDWVIGSSDVNWPSRSPTTGDIGNLKTSDNKNYRKDSNVQKTVFGTANLNINNVLFMNGEKDEYGDEKTKWCGGTAYYKITPTTSWTLPASKPIAEQDELVRQNAGIQSSVTQEGTMPECSIGIGSGSVLGCIAQIMYGLIFKPLSWIAALFGYLFDFFIGYSLSDESYRMGFAVTGWQLVRDISNIFFIIILVWTGFATVFGIGGISMKKVVPALLINAIIINFSLFATRAVIDLSNVVARVFYSQIAVCDNPTCAVNPTTGKVEYKRGVGGYWPLSEKIVASFNPQKIMTPSILAPRQAGAVDKDGKAVNTDTTSSSFDSNTSDAQNAEVATAGATRSSSEYAAYFILVTIIGSAIMFGIAMMFWKVAFMFLGRVIGLYICMIFAPFAFLTRGNLPLISGIKELSFSKWSNDLTNYALLAPIFIFFLYIIYSFLQTDFMNEFSMSSSATDFFTNVLWITIPMLFIYTLIGQGVDIAKKYAGEMGNKMQAFGEKAFGAVAGVGLAVATGGAALGLRGIAAGVGSAAGKSGLAGKLASSNSMFGRGANSMLKWSQTSSMDMRNTKLGGFAKTGLKGFGIDTKGFDDYGKEAGRGGASETRKAFGKFTEKVSKFRKGIPSDEKDVDFSHLSDIDAKTAWKAYSTAEAKKKATKEAEHSFAASKDTGYVKAGEAAKEKEKESKKLKEEVEKLKEERNSAVTTNERKDEIKKEIRTKNTEYRDVEKQIADLKEAQKLKRAQVLQQNSGYENSNEYKNAFVDAAKKEQENLEKKYGEIKNSKELNAAMQSEYVDRVLGSGVMLTEDRKAFYQKKQRDFGEDSDKKQRAKKVAKAREETLKKELSDAENQLINCLDVELGIKAQNLDKITIEKQEEAIALTLQKIAENKLNIDEDYENITEELRSKRQELNQAKKSARSPSDKQKIDTIQKGIENLQTKKKDLAKSKQKTLDKHSKVSNVMNNKARAEKGLDDLYRNQKKDSTSSTKDTTKTTTP